MFGRRERFDKHSIVRVLHPGYFKMEETVLKQKMTAQVPSVGKHEVKYLKEGGYWLIMANLA